MAKLIRVAFFGNGFSRKVMLPCLRHVEGIEVVGIASPTLARAEETAREFDIPFVSTEHRELLERTSPDLVFVVTPPHRHLDQSRDVLESGAHLVCEKPMALSSEQTAEMVRLAEAHPEQLALLDHELRFDPKRRRIESWIEEGRLGKIYHGIYTIDSPGRMSPDLPWTWWSDKEQGGGMLGALGSHAVDAVRTFLGEIQSVRGTLATAVSHRVDPTSGEERAVTADDYASAILQMESGAMVDMRVSGMGGERHHEIRIHGDDGAVHLVEQGPLRASFAAKTLLKTQPVADELPSNETLGIPDSDWARNFLRYARDIVFSIREGHHEVPGAATFAQGHRTQLVLDAIRRSHEESKWIPIT